MNHRTITLAFSLLAAGGLAATTDSWSFDYGGRPIFTIVGMCQATTEDVTCWQPDGAPAPRLREYVNAALLIQNSSFQFRYKRRNLMLLCEIADWRSVDEPRLSTVSMGGPGFQGQFQIANPDWNGLNLTAYSVQPTEAAVGSAEATFYRSIRAEPMPLRADAEGKLGEDRLTVDSVARIADEPARSPSGPVGDQFQPGARRWLVKLRYDGPAGDLESLSLSFIDRDGKSVNAVDRTGKPRQAPNGLGPAFGDFGREYHGQLYVRELGGYVTTVDPKRVASVVFSASRSSGASFEGIALRPSNAR